VDEVVEVDRNVEPLQFTLPSNKLEADSEDTYVEFLIFLLGQLSN
jgi:hypothetical protein